MLRVVAAVALLAFTVYTLIDCVQAEDSKVRGLPKLAWVFVVLLFPLAGGVVWWIAGRPGGLPITGSGLDSRPHPGPQDRPRRRGPIGPDDDPDFLGRL